MLLSVFVPYANDDIPMGEIIYIFTHKLKQIQELRFCYSKMARKSVQADNALRMYTGSLQFPL